MRSHLGTITLAGLIVAALLLYTITFQVDELRDIVLVTTFGEVTQELPGKDHSGLKLKWPWPFQKVVRYDSRVFVFEDTFETVQTKDNQDLLVTLYCTWRIESPKTFHTSVKARDAEAKQVKAEGEVRRLLRSAKKTVIGKHTMSSFVNTDPKQMQLSEIEDQILAGVRDEAGRTYGVEVLRVGIKSLGLPKDVTTAVIDSMKAERQRAVKRYESQGKAFAQAVKSRAEEARQRIIAFADRKAREIRAEGDQAAAEYYRKFRADPEFAAFLRSLESLKKELASKTVFLLDGRGIPAVRWFKDGASVSTAMPAASKAPSENKAPAESKGPSSK